MKVECKRQRISRSNVCIGETFRYVGETNVYISIRTPSSPSDLDLRLSTGRTESRRSCAVELLECKVVLDA